MYARKKARGSWVSVVAVTVLKVWVHTQEPAGLLHWVGSLALFSSPYVVQANLSAISSFVGLVFPYSQFSTKSSFDQTFCFLSRVVYEAVVVVSRPGKHQSFLLGRTKVQIPNNNIVEFQYFTLFFTECNVSWGLGHRERSSGKVQKVPKNEVLGH